MTTGNSVASELMRGRLQPVACDKRTEPRTLCSQLVGIEWTDGDLRVQNCVVNLEDISASGASLQSEQAIPVETRVKIAYGDEHLSGAVRYCVRRSFGYSLGIQFDAHMRWSRKRFRPQHLTDLQEL